MLADRVVIVTGSTTGIGRAIAAQCIAEGARVVVHGRDERRGRDLVAPWGDRAVFHADDLSDPASAGWSDALWTLLAGWMGLSTMRRGSSVPIWRPTTGCWIR